MDPSDVPVDGEHVGHSHSWESLLELDSEVTACLEDYYSHLDFLEESSAAIQECLSHARDFADDTLSGNSDDGSEPLSSNSDEQYYDEEDVCGVDVDAQSLDESEEQLDNGDVDELEDNDYFDICDDCDEDSEYFDY